MRIALAVLALCALGCGGDRYGTYLTIDGDSTDIGFDRVELFFGRWTDETALVTPGLVSRMGRVFERQYDSDDDDFAVPRIDGQLAQEATLYIPANDRNDHLGDYVLALAYDGQTIVGIGELEYFEVEQENAYWKFDVELVPYNPGEVERWGERPGCIAWSKIRDGNVLTTTTHAVVDRNDHDCDGFEEAYDCAPTTHCTGDDPVLCSPQTTCNINDRETCALGCGDLGMCERRVCMYPGFCSVDCQFASVDSRHSCGITESLDHIEVIAVTSPTKICRPEIKVVPYDQSCRDAKLEFVTEEANDETEVEVDDDGYYCIVRLIQPPSQTAPFKVKKHVVISFDNPDPGPRWSIVVGITPRSDTTECEGDTEHQITVAGEPADCQ